MQYYCLTPMTRNFCTFFMWNQFQVKIDYQKCQAIIFHVPREVQYYCSTPMTRNFCTFFTWNQFHEFFPDFTYRAMYENCLMLYSLYNCHPITISTLILYSTKVLTYYITTYFEFPSLIIDEVTLEWNNNISCYPIRCHRVAKHIFSLRK